jgi:glycosyltransferase involved in cell wall biosynthesis
MRRFAPHVVVSSGPPHSAHLVARMAMIGSRARWYLDLRDPWAGPYTKAWDSDPEVGTWIFRVLSPPLEQLAVGAAHGVITNTQPLAAALAARYLGVSVACIPNGVDLDCLPPPAATRYPGMGIAYAGTLYGSRDLRPVMQALHIFFARHPEAAEAGSKLRFVGQAEARYARAFDDAVAALGMQPYVEILGRLPRTEALNVVSRSRLVVVLAQDQELQIPAKLYESVAMRIPTLVVAPPDSAAGVEGRRVGALVRDANDVEGIACVFEDLWRDDSRWRAPCPVPITYEAIAPLVDEVLRGNGALPPRRAASLESVVTRSQEIHR